MVESSTHHQTRGRDVAAEEALRRRKIAHEMRAAREKLTSSTGLERSFDYELLRLFAQYRIGAALPLFGLAAAVAALAGLWVPLEPVLIWLGQAVATTGLPVALAHRFLRQEESSVSLPRWRRIFILSELLQGAGWAPIVLLLVKTDTPVVYGFVLFVTLMVAAVTATLSATVRLAVYAGIAPLALALVFAVASAAQRMDTLLLALMSVSAQLFFVLLAHRLYSSAVATLHSRAEKDALFAELEQAKANSDEARRRAEEANLAKSRFLATMSHELRTPLNAILGFSEVMKNEVFGPHASPSYKDYSGDIHASGQHLLTLINEILDLSRIEAGRYELNEEALRLSHVVEDARHMLNLRAKAKNQTVKEVVDPSLPRLWADERAVRQIVLNILSNAIKFTPQGGEITIKVGWTGSGGQYVSVRDNGPGIPDEEIPVVMSSFGRGSWALKTAEQGSGLGLPIVKGLVDLHGGTFQLKSKPREGTEAIVTFPASRVMDALPPVDDIRAA
ncbi:sensor histidine kinase [Salinarimonas soli]|uniref:histidine kinase n=1 Tax=Salinarimonas soli TaxID=1638099 RepID=A0A5B2VBN0_9HYPH|nr:HAMP domain-containing sensor histidine kinase [Salinarimonas soli]KAA2236186.1 HAMP domain-containing histidine kinase [Salinarimonas soli]